MAGMDSVILDQILDAVRALSSRVERTTSRPDDVHEDLYASMKVLTEHLESLPDRIAAALGDALGRQHRLIMGDIQSTLQAFKSNVDSSSEIAVLKARGLKQPPD
jgi:hypothetical protein